MKTHRWFFSVALLILAGFVLPTEPTADSTWAAERQANSPAQPKYVFLFLADGAGITHMEITRLYNRFVHDEDLVIADRIMKEGTLGLVTTHAADSLSTDSAAAAKCAPTKIKRPIVRILR